MARVFLSDDRLCQLIEQLVPLFASGGIIDTRRNALSITGLTAGRLNWCICPNGRQGRKDGPEPTEAQLLLRRAGRFT